MIIKNRIFSLGEYRAMAVNEYEDYIKEIVYKPNHADFIYESVNVYDIPKTSVTDQKSINWTILIH